MIGFVGTLSNDALMPVHQALFDSILSGDAQSRILVPDAELQMVQTTLLTTAIAFANTAGGKVLIGVDDKTGEILGLNADHLPHVINTIRKAILDACIPHSLHVVPVGDKTIVVLEIYPGNETPYYLKSKTPETGTFVRVNSTTRQADEYWVKELQFVGVRRSFDQQLVRGTSYLSATEIEGGIAKVDRRLNAHPLYLFPNNRLLVNRFSVIDKHLCHLRITTSTST